MRFINKSIIALAAVSAHLGGCGNKNEGSGGTGGGIEADEQGRHLSSLDQPGEGQISLKELSMTASKPSDAVAIVKAFDRTQRERIKAALGTGMDTDVNLVKSRYERELQLLGEEANRAVDALKDSELSESELEQAISGISIVREKVASERRRNYEFDLAVARNRWSLKNFRNEKRGWRFEMEIEKVLMPFRKKEVKLDALKAEIESAKHRFVDQHPDMTEQERTKLDKIVHAFVLHIAARRHLIITTSRLSTELGGVDE